MITAARAGGHVDENEMNVSTRQIENLRLEQDVTRFLLFEMSMPADLARIATLADTPEMAAELYIASVMAVDLDQPAELSCLDKLAVAMGLDSQPVAQLEAPLRD